MARCPKMTSIMQVVESNFTSVETEEILSHALVCKECAEILQDAIEIQKHDAGEHVADVSQTELNNALNALKKVSDQRELKSIISDQGGKEPGRDLKSRLKDFVGGMAATAGVASMRDLLSGMSHVPAFGESGEKDSHHGERNFDNTPSFTDKESDFHNGHSNEERYMPSTDNHIFQPAPTEFGLPGVDGKSANVAQHYPDTCAIRSQQLVLRDFGINLSEDDLRKEAIEQGWYKPGGGTSASDIGKLLEKHEVPVHRYEGANIFNLANELAQGHKVIIGVNSGDLWHPGMLNSLADKLGLQGADHALLVSGIDTSDPGHVKVILTDPGTGHIAKEYPMEQFIDAWKDSNCLMVSTDHPAPEWLHHPEMANFDYNLGHIPNVGTASYEQFHNAVKESSSYQHDPTAWESFHSSFVGSFLSHIPAVTFLEHIGSRIESVGQYFGGDAQQNHHDADNQLHPGTGLGNLGMGKGSWEHPTEGVNSIDSNHPGHQVSSEIGTPSWVIPSHPESPIDHHLGYHPEHHDLIHHEIPDSSHAVEEDHHDDDDHHHES